jgi:RNA polymerase sigma-70 factor (ECF subfamily)
VKTKYQGSAADYKKLSDEELVHRFVHRHEQVAMNFLFERYGHLVLGVCLKYLKDNEAAKDATQQIFIKLLDDLHRFKIDNFKPWLMQVSRNFCLMQMRSKVKVKNNQLETNMDMESEEDWHRKIEEENLYNQLELALKELNKEQRTCIEFFYLNKMTYAEITKATGYRMQEVKSHLQNGKRNLKNKMEALSDVRK